MNLAVVISGMNLTFLILTVLLNVWYTRSFRKSKDTTVEGEVVKKNLADEKRDN